VWNLLNAIGERVMKDLNDLHRMEIHRPFTSTCEHFLQRRFDICQKLQSSITTEDHRANFETEIFVKSYMITYWEFSSQRFRDLVPMILETKLARDFSDQVQEELKRQLDLFHPNAFTICERYLEDDPGTRARRNNLRNCERILREAVEIFERFKNEI